MNDDQQNLEVIMNLIINGGDAKSSSMEAIQAAKENKFDEADRKLQEADNALSKAHKSQTDLLKKEASGDLINISLLMIHGQDHLMNAITFRDMAGEIVTLYKR